MPSLTAIAAMASLTLAQTASAEPARTLVNPTGLDGYTVYLPAGRTDRPLPIVLWANGGCRLDPSRYASTLKAIAEQGFLVIAIGNPGTGRERSPDTRPAPRTLSERIARITPPESRTEQLTAALDWAQRRASDPASELRGRIATHRVAMMGHSCGGMQALEASLDPRVTTTVVWSSGLWRYGGDLPGIKLNRAMLQQLHAPVIYLHGGATDIAHNNGEGDFVELNRIPVFKASSPAPHALTFADAAGGIFGQVGIAWLRWQLLDDAKAGRQFVGDACGLCTDPRWTIEKKKIP